MPWLIETAACAAGGAALALAYLPRSLCWWTAWVALLPLLWAIDGKTPRRAFLLGWVYGTAGWMTAMHWMLGPIQSFLRLSAPAALAAFILVWAFHGLVFGLGGGVAALLEPGARRLGLPARWSLAAAFIPVAVAGDGLFPMLVPARLAYSQLGHLPQLQSAELFGTAGLGWLLVAFNSALFIALRTRSRSGGAAAGALLLLALANEGYGLLRIRRVDRELEGEPGFRVGLVQGALAGKGRQGPAALETQNRLSDELLSEGPLDLIAWPESSFGYPIEYGRGGDQPREPTIDGLPAPEFLRRRVNAPVPMLFNTRGLDRRRLDEYGRSFPQRGYNVAFLAGADKSLLGLLEKRTLFPFGEYIPMGRWFPSFYRLSPQSYRLSRGGPARLLELPGGARLGVLMCYEDLMPAAARAHARLGANLLVSMVEGTWFREVGCEQHLLCSIPRAIETRRWMLRVANYGVTAVIDPVGRVVARLDPGKPAAVDAEVSLREGSRLAGGLAPALYGLALAAVLGLARLTQLSRARASAPA